MSQDAVIIGAGLIGCGIAYELAKRGATVTVYDRAEPARAASWAGAGMLAPYSEEVVDPALLALCAASLRAYPAFVDDLRERTGVDAHLRSEGTLHVAFDDSSAHGLTTLCEAFRRNGAVASVLDRDAAVAHEPMLGGNVRGAVYVANEAHVDNRRLGAIVHRHRRAALRQLVGDAAADEPGPDNDDVLRHALHAGVDGAFAALRRDPRDDLIGIHDVAGLAVHAVREVDLQAAFDVAVLLLE